jgi:hypothetical protein
MIRIETRDFTINSGSGGKTIIECDIDSLNCDINEILSHYNTDDLLDYNDIDSVISKMDENVLMEYISESTIFDYVMKNKDIIEDVLNSVDDSVIISKARKLKISNLLSDE